jgi:hypothetical protein
MKLRLILIFSVCVNLALAGAYLMSKRVAPSTAAAPEAAVTPVKTATKSDRERRALLTGTITTNDFRWASVESDDYREYIANLRAIGVPEETIRDIIIADVNKLYAGRLAALYPSPQDFKWWQTDERSNRDERRDRERKRRDLNEEKRALVKELLGVDLEEQQIDQQLQATLGPERYAEYKLAQDDSYRRVYDFTLDQKLSKETALSLYDMQKVAGQQREQLMSDQSISPEERTAKLAEIAAVTKQTLAQTLPQQAYEQYLRSDAGRWVPALTSTQQGGRQGPGGRGGFGGFPGGGPGGPDRRYFRGGGGR